MRLARVVLLIALMARVASAQTVAGDRVRLNAAPCTIDSVNGTPDKLRFVDCSVLTTSSATNLTLNPTGDLVLSPTGLDVLPNSGYAVNLGALTNKYLTLHAAELWVETLVAQNTIATIGGRVLVAPTNTLTADIGTGATAISVKYNNLTNGDRVYMEANGAVEWMAIASSASGSGPYTYSVTRNLDGSGANAWSAGDAVLDTGTTGNGFIDLYSTAGVLSGSGPTIVGNVRTGTTYSAVAPRWAIGNLNGLYGYGATTYGTAFGDASATNVTIDATNGFRIRSGTTNKLVANTSGDLALTGAFSIGTSGSFSSGASSYSSGTGWWMDYNAGTPRFRIGNPAGNQLTWDGSTLTIAGDGAGVTNIAGSNIQTGTVSAAKLTVGAGRNLIRNSDCSASTTDWIVQTSSAATFGFTGPSNVSGKRLKDLADNTCYFTPTSGTPANATLTYAQSVSFPVIAGQKYEASVYVGTANMTNASVRLWFLDATETTGISIVDGNMCTPAAGAGGTELSQWCRSAVVTTAPVGAARARVLVQANHSGAASPVLYFVHAYFGEGYANQTEFTPWGAAGVTEIVGGQIRTGTITASNIAANTITASQIAAGTITATQIAGGTITASQIAAGSITGSNIAAGTITASNLSVSSLSALTANLGSVTSGEISISTGGSNGLFFNVGGSGDFVAGNFGGGSGTKIEAGGNFTTYGTSAFYGSLTGVYSTQFYVGSAVNFNALGGGGTQYVCVTNSGDLYSAPSC